jgi:uncharacterized membrane protein
VFSRRARLALSLVAVGQCALLLGLSWARYTHVHQRTFDLALYARMAWGFAHGDLWAPIVGAPALGCHLSPVLLPLGLLGRLLGTVPVLLSAQALAIALTLFPMARIGARRLGTRGMWLGVVAWALYPNLFHVGTYEFHPGTLAVLPMAWAFDALDRAKLEQLGWCLLGVLVCREDLGAFCIVLTLVFYARQRSVRALYLTGLVGAYTLASLALVMSLAPRDGSLSAHFAPWGGSPLGVLRVLFQEPTRVLSHFRARALYLPQVLAPLSFFSLRAPQLLLPALPYLLLNMLSAFPTADEQFSHYLTPAVPALIVSGIVGFTELKKPALKLLWFCTLGIAHFALGGSPLSRDFDNKVFHADDATHAAARVLAQIPLEASVQAPDALLPHLAERHDVRRAPHLFARAEDGLARAEAGLDFTVLDISHRLAFARKETLLRTTEEPLIRGWLARETQTLLVYAPPYALFARANAAPRGGAAAATCLHAGEADEKRQASALRITACLAASQAELATDTLTVTLVARAACPADLALRLGPDAMPARVELLCGGALSPKLLQRGDVLRFGYRVTSTEARLLRERGLWLGALRASGAPVLAGDPAAISLPLTQR